MDSDYMYFRRDIVEDDDGVPRSEPVLAPPDRPMAVPASTLPAEAHIEAQTIVPSSLPQPLEEPTSTSLLDHHRSPAHTEAEFATNLISQPSVTDRDHLPAIQNIAPQSSTSVTETRPEPQAQLAATHAMADKEIKEGDQVSWNWGGGKPGGEAAEVKEGEISMTTKKGNEVKKKGEEGNPAVKISRSGQDVVKKASELNVEESKGEEKGDKEETNGEEKAEEKGEEAEANGEAEKTEETGKANTGEKRKAEEDKSGPKKKGRPAKGKANGSAAPKKETKKREPKKAATESGEPRRSGRNASKSS